LGKIKPSFPFGRNGAFLGFGLKCGLLLLGKLQTVLRLYIPSKRLKNIRNGRTEVYRLNMMKEARLLVGIE